jgi:pyruvate dehydrogenase E1 component alpha subunit
MFRIRTFEERVSRLYAKSEIPGFVHLYIGEEAVACGVCSNLNDDDFITSTHRGHGHLIAKGGDPKRMMAELYGRRTGYCKGKGGSMHIADMDLGILGANGIVAGGLPIAVGAAYSSMLRETSQVAVAFFGDGATNEGVFHEALNVASAWNLPIVFVCENNQFGVSARLDRVVRETDISKRALAHGMEGIRIDGNDVLAVKETSATAITKAREGKGPTLIVCQTFRFKGHFEGENVNYLNEGELESWKKRDPIPAYAEVLLADGVRQEELDEREEKVRSDIEAAIEFARASELPDPQDALTDLFN